MEITKDWIKDNINVFKKVIGDIKFSFFVIIIFLLLKELYFYLLNNLMFINCSNNITDFINSKTNIEYKYIISLILVIIGFSILSNIKKIFILIKSNFNYFVTLIFWGLFTIIPHHILMQDINLTKYYFFGLLFCYFILSSIYHFNTKKKEKDENYNFDIPIQKIKDDKLNFEDNVNNLSSKIGNFNKKGSLVLSIESSWGNGKTSFINLLTEKLKQDNFSIIEINTWDISKNNNILEFLFISILDKISNFKDVSKLRKSLFKFLSIINGLTIKNDIFNYKFNINDSSFELDKDIIIEELLKLSKKLIIVIDDLDRVKFERFMEILRILNITRDFPNIIFILSFDSENINKFDVEIKDRFLTFKGENITISEDINNIRIIKYIEKVIDIKYLLTYDLDYIKQDFISKLMETFKGYNNGDEIAFKQYITYVVEDLYKIDNFSIYSTHISNLRNIKKIINTIDVNKNLVFDEIPGLFEKINLLEYIKLILVYLYYPKIFNDIYNQTNLHKYYSTSIFTSDSNSGDIIELRKKYLISKNLNEQYIVNNIFFNSSIETSIEKEISLNKGKNENIKRVLALITNNKLILNQVRHEIEIDSEYSKFNNSEIDINTLFQKLNDITEYGEKYFFQKIYSIQDKIDLESLLEIYKNYTKNSFFVLDKIIELFYLIITKNKDNITKYIINKENNIFQNILKEDNLIYLFLVLELRSYFKDKYKESTFTGMEKLNENVKNLLENKVFIDYSNFNLIEELYHNRDYKYGEYFLYIIYQLGVEIGIINFKEYVIDKCLNKLTNEYKKFFKNKMLNYYEDNHNSGRDEMKKLFSEDFINNL